MTQPPAPSALRAFLDAVLEQPEHERTLRFSDWRRGAVASVAIGALAAGAGGCDGPGRSVAIYSAPIEPMEQNCSNEVDDDEDGTTDCGDPDCCGRSYCSNVSSCPEGTGGFILAVSEYRCADGIDEDTDGRTDCDDPDCFADATCRGAGGAAGAGGASTFAGSAGRGGAL